MFNLLLTRGRHMNGTCLSVDLAQARRPDGGSKVNRRRLFRSLQFNYHTWWQML